MGGATTTAGGTAGMDAQGGGGGDVSASGAPGAGAAGDASAGAGGDTGGGPAPIVCNPGTTGDGTFEELGPDYPASPESTASGAPQGAISSGTYQSALYTDSFPYQIYVPAQYAEAQKAALMVFQDGSRYLGQVEGLFNAQHVMDNLIDAGEMPVTIGLFLDTPPGGEDRRREVYDDPTNLYARFLVEEAVPDLILAQYNVVEHPDAWATVGFSAGGSSGFGALVFFNDFFHKNLGTNSSFLAIRATATAMPALGYSDYIDVMNALPDSAVLRTSLLSSPNDLSDDRGDWLTGNREVATALTAKGHAVRMIEGVGGHYPPNHGSQDLADAMRWIWQGCELQ
jgi:enterochelin esterase family protein